MLANSEIVATIAVTDLDAAKKFYSDTLGLELLFDAPEGARYQCGRDTHLEVYPSQFARTAQNTVATFMVDDLDAVMSGLRGKGVTFEEYDFPGMKTVNGVVDMGGSRGCWFKDPDGNILALRQDPVT